MLHSFILKVYLLSVFMLLRDRTCNIAIMLFKRIGLCLFFTLRLLSHIFGVLVNMLTAAYRGHHELGVGKEMTCECVINRLK